MTAETPEYKPGGLVPEPARVELPDPGEPVHTLSSARQWLEEEGIPLDSLASGAITPDRLAAGAHEEA